MTTYRRPAEHRLDAAAQPAGSFRLCRPQRLDDLHDERGVDCLHRECADHRRHVGLQAARPLSAMDQIFPSGSVLPHVALGGLIERHRSGARSEIPRDLRVPHLDRVVSFQQQLAVFARLLSRFDERDGGGASQPRVADTSAALESENPTSPAHVAVVVSRDLQIQATAIRMQSRLFHRPICRG
jgi:hypothetical protein